LKDLGGWQKAKRPAFLNSGSSNLFDKVNSGAAGNTSECCRTSTRTGKTFILMTGSQHPLRLLLLLNPLPPDRAREKSDL
jgi:hypothetical protein